MRTSIEYFLIIFSLGIFITNILILISLFKIKKSIKDSSFSQDERYYELKLRIQVLIITTVIAGFAISFLGWNIQDNIIQSVKRDIGSEISPLINKMKDEANQASQNINLLSGQYNEQSKNISKITSINNILGNKVDSLNNIVGKKLENLKTLLNIYIVSDLNLNLESGDQTFYFRNMKPINADRLPIFKKDPIVNIQTDNSLGVDIVKITKEYIVLSPSHGIITEQGKALPGKITLWFIENNY